jgi:dihydroflavonol-4-reductase
MRVLVTGATGHVGTNLVRQLLEDGHQVRVLVHRNLRPLEGLDVERVTGDVLDPGTLPAAMDGVEILFHLAALISIVGSQRGRVEAINVQGVRNVAEAALAAGVRRMVHVSSIHAFDLSVMGGAVDESWPRATEPTRPAYDRSKYAGERALREVIERGLDAVVVNPTGVLGPYDFEPSHLGTALLMMARGRLPALVPGGFDWVDVRDVAASIRAAVEHGQRGENYILGGNNAEVSGLASHLEEFTGRRPPRITVPLGLALAVAPFVEGWTQVFGGKPIFTRESLHTLAGNGTVSSAKAREVLGHDPRPLRDTLADTFAWFAAEGSFQPRTP